DGGTAIVKTSAIPGRLPKWWQIASGDDWSLFRLGRGYAMIFENRIETLARCYVNGRYYEINSEDIGAEEITELLTEICS
ncbi:MAG: hypothetical protein II350_05480, partial [Clostridia bacterium]|nr:hypothetical protein [Clostridia bacterium]